MMCAYLLEMALFPYVIFIDIMLPLKEPLGFYYYAELTIDIFHVINMACGFVTAIRSDQGWIIDPKVIALNYIT